MASLICLVVAFVFTLLLVLMFVVYAVYRYLFPSGYNPRFLV